MIKTKILKKLTFKENKKALIILFAKSSKEAMHFCTKVVGFFGPQVPTGQSPSGGKAARR